MSSPFNDSRSQAAVGKVRSALLCQSPQDFLDYKNSDPLRDLSSVVRLDLDILRTSQSLERNGSRVMANQEQDIGIRLPPGKPGFFRYRTCICLIVTFAMLLFSLDAIFYQGIVPHIPGLVGNTLSKIGIQVYETNTSAHSAPSWYFPFPKGQRHQPSLPLDVSNATAYIDNLRNGSNGSFTLGPVASGGEYSTQASSEITEVLREKLKNLDIEPAEDHVFKSPFIVTPTVYPQPKKQQANDGVRTKVISVFNAPAWYRRPGLPNLMAYNRDFHQCPYYKCEVDMEAKKLQHADMVIFFVGAIGSRPPPPRPVGQIWVKAYWESPIHYGYPKNYAPWKSVFNLTYNFRVDSDIFAPNNFLAWRHRSELLSDEEYLQIALKKKKPVAWWVSNCNTQSKRQEYVQEMKKYIDVDIYGKCGNLKCTKTTMAFCKQQLNTTYSFYLSFENSLCRDYITEKFYRNFESRTHIVPVVRGGANYHRYFPPEGFIDAKLFPKARDLALYLQKLAADPVKYARMLREKDRLVTLGYKHDWCDLCRQLHTTGFPAKTIPDIKAWSHSKTCSEPNDIR
ncbi:alpha-(1,3)-fucosyltransferase 6-like [Plakobranchus ocellatus]|uniref:Fucosyltransferase n=1 Tax=Plakobranchus ocellatus TaxID=259542 RepID=A0AAV4DP00_9GAST|nr:alpha-(1,3)-fucosyltransferase 6-like [Plakobranchus ocellatus]